MFVQRVYACTPAPSFARSLAHTLARSFSGKGAGWNRVTLRLIRKLMHRKSRQRHCSPSARGAGENNLHIGRLMDTFIGSTGRGDGGVEEETERERKRRGAVIGPGPTRASDPDHAAKPDSGVSDNT